MSSFEIAKETMMLMITVFVLVFLTVFFYITLGNFNIGSEINVNDRNTELIALRTLKCLESDEKLDECIRISNNIVVKAEKDGEEMFVNKDVYTSEKDFFTTVYNFKDKYKIMVMFKLTK